VPRGASQGRSPTPGLLIGLVLTLAAVAAYAHSIARQIASLRVLQSNLVDRNRRDSLQLLRAQNDLNQLGLAMRDMLDEAEPYPLTAWSAQFARIRTDLTDALAREAELAGGSPQADPDGLADSLAQFWDAVDRTFALAANGRADEARAQVRVSLQARQASLTTTVARRLVANNERDEDAGARVQAIYDQVQRQGYGFLAATLLVIAGTSLYLIRANRRLFAELASLSDRRRELAQQLIATRESTLRHVSRELHDELGQILTAMGSMLGRAERRTAESDPLRRDLREIGEMAQSTLNTVRSLSQTLHPSILDELGLESTIEWYVTTVKKQLGVEVTYERSGTPVPVDATVGIHVYRILQEAMNNVAKHAGTDRAWVRLRYLPRALELEVEDHGRGLGAPSSGRGLGVIAMRERAELVSGTLTFVKPDAGGTLVRVHVPLEDAEGDGR
jgi:signal transduction histidine kinase